MKKYINLAFIYALAGMVAGIFYREFTQFFGYTGETALSALHTHLFALGMVMLLVVAVCVKVFPVGPTRLMIWFDFTYNTGLILTVLLLGIRGCLEVVGTSLSVRGNLVISGLAGVGHILLGGGIVLFFLCLKQSKQVD